MSPTQSTAGPIIGIIGYGRFGRAFGELCERNLAGSRLLAFDTLAPIDPAIRAESVEFLAERADVIVVATPVAHMPEMFGRLAASFAATGRSPLVMDVGSVKVVPHQALATAFRDEPQVRAVATHPLFGPMSLGRAERPMTVIVCPSENAKANDDAEAFWKSLDCETIRVSAEEHDRVMARTHALAFFFAKGIVDAKLDAPAPFSPPSFRAMARSIEAVRADAGHLFRSIEVDNPFAGDMRTTLLRTLAAADDELTRPAEAESSTIPPVSPGGGIAAVGGAEPAGELSEARRLIDDIDVELIDILARRAELAERAAKAKAVLRVGTRDEAREAALLADRRAWAERAGLDPDAIADVFGAILRFSRAHQRRR